MRILELEIGNIRGIRSLTLRPEGNTIVVCGPNGTGKSTVIDAVDFLLTGNISRLQGKGTGGITLRDHGKHVDAKRKDAFVRAMIKLDEHDEPVEVVRRMAKAKEIECDPAMLPRLEPLLTLASRRQYVLTRRELLRYVTADGATRAQAVEELLALDELKPVQKCVVESRRIFKAARVAQKSRVDVARGSAARRLELSSYESENVLAAMKALRGVLDAPPLAELRSDQILEGVRRPPTSNHVSREALRSALDHLEEARKPDAVDKLALAQASLLDALTTVAESPRLDQAIKLQELASTGRSLVDETGTCPLCETPFPPGELIARLEERIAIGKRAAELLEAIASRSESLQQGMLQLAQAVRAVMTAAEAVGTIGTPQLQAWAERLKSSATDAAAAATARRFEPGDQPPWTTWEELEAELSELQSEPMNAACPTPQEGAWDTLVKLAEDLRSVEKEEASLGVAEARSTLAEALVQQFQDSRNRVLSSLYEDVRERFERLYKSMNEDEEQFSARLEPEGSSLEFTVDFYQRGQHPPHALHSEGHQDSMGLCLYLALAERLSRGLISVVLLDDVVMSVDAEHRRKFCKVLKEAFPAHQFIITTHDDVWAKQLRTEGVVTKKHMIEFGGWDIAHGPHVAQSGLWEDIDAAMERRDVEEAAWRLRRGLEEYFATVCELLHAKVEYQRSGQYALEQLLAPAYSRLNELLRQGKQAANSWNDDDRMARIKALENDLSASHARTKAERWGVNTAVHYNAWANLSFGDFAPTVEAFKKFCASFECSSCATPLRVVSGPGIENVTCQCGQLSWSLTKQPKS